MKRLKKVHPLELNQAKEKVLLWFFSFPTHEMSLNDLCLQLQIAKTTAKRTVQELIEEGFLNVKVLGKLWRITPNPSHLYTYTLKIPYNLRLIYESGIIGKIHKQVPEARTIVLFGSYRKGDDAEASDIDIAVEVTGSQQTAVKELGVFPQFGYRKDVRINLHVFSRETVDQNLFANIANGIVLEGFLEVKP
ncbi:TPA: hypothetical protein HA281_06380 [Candidatus Woesearchaeota archaeon]|nr:MAG: Transcriptional regulator [archaeon GW2011_AR11]HIH92396.1 hypothetical protein [Candidatus Woesearchaeota archaeon]HII64481.1 hypothetical protein [Candidatus Woesearchaeota archaeon]HIJ18357.1 hypothetical protein [Candidatus Woesearchaeota archaeon]